MPQAKQAQVLRCSYRSIGPMNNVDALVVEFEVGGEVYEQPFPNQGWTYQTPALCFLAYLEKKPTDINGTSFDVEEDVEVPAMFFGEMDGFMILDSVLVNGSQKLKEADWFDPDGNVHDSESNQGIGGMNIDGGTGNQATVEAKSGGDG